MSGSAAFPIAHPQRRLFPSPKRSLCCGLLLLPYLLVSLAAQGSWEVLPWGSGRRTFGGPGWKAYSSQSQRRHCCPPTATTPCVTLELPSLTLQKAHGYQSPAPFKGDLQDSQRRKRNWPCCQDFEYKLWTQEQNSFSGAEFTFLRRREGAEGLHLPLASAASGRPWGHFLFSLIPSWTKKIVFKRESIVYNQPREDTSRISVSSEHGLTFQKCAVVNTQSEPQTASVKLLATNINSSSSSSDVSDLIIVDNITSLIIQKNNGNNSGNGYQTYTRTFLQVGDYFLINYIAALNTTVSQTGKILSLPAQINFYCSSQSTQLSSLVAPFTITVEENPKVAPNHGIHGAGFVIAFFVSLLLTCIIFITIYHRRGRKGCFASKNLESRHNKHEQKLEPSQLNLADSKIEDIITSDKLLDILAFEETENMLQALEDSETANMTQADAHLESCRMHICKDVIAILLRNMVFNNNLSIHEEKRLQESIKKNCSKLETSMHDEHERKMVALAAECNLETRKEMEILRQRQIVSKEEVEELIKLIGEKPAEEYRILVDKLHEKEQNEMKRLLLLKQEEEFVKAHRQLAVSQRIALHDIFFNQVQDAVLKKELKKDAVRTMVEDYAEIQNKTEDLMDFLEANKKYRLNQRFSCRKYMIYNLQLSENQTRCLLNTAATQIASLINKMQSAGHVTENHSGALLDLAQTEVNSVKEKLDSALKQEKRKLHQKMIIKRKRQMLQKLKEQRKELISVEEMFKTTRDVVHYVSYWQKLFTDQSLEFEDLIEKLDSDAAEEFKGLKCSLTEKATEDLMNIQNVILLQALLKVPVPRLPLQQVLEEHRKELALLTQQLEKEETEKGVAAKVLLQNTRRKLNEDLELNVKEQKSLRNWEQLVFQKVLCLPLLSSEEEVITLKQEFYSSFSQMDSSLALPMARTRRMLQLSQSEWRKHELLKVDQYLSAQDKLEHSMMKKQRPQEKKIDLLKKYIEDKLHIHEQFISDDRIKEIHGQLLLERVQQLKTQETKLGEYIASLQFQKSVKKSKALEVHIAVIHLQAMLLEELCTSQTLTVSECTQLLEGHQHENGELFRKLESESSQNESTQHRDLLKKRQRLAADSLEIANEVGEDVVDRHMTALLRHALHKSKELIDQQRESLKEEELCMMLIEGQREKIENDSRDALHSQEQTLASYLTKQAMVPAGMMYRVLNLLLPSSSGNEILSVLNSILHKYSDGNAEPDYTGEETDSCRKRKPHDSWRALEIRLRQSLIAQGLEKTPSSSRRKGSILKKKRLKPVKRVAFSHIESLAKLPPVEPYGLSKTFDSAAVAMDYTDTREKLFVFRLPKDSTSPSLKSSKKKKKRNFLNFKKSSIANVDY